MRRRAFIASLGGAVAWPFVAHGQQPERMRRIGYLMDRTGPGGPFEQGFLQGLKERGYVPGKSVVIEFRWTDGKTERLAALAQDLIDLKVEVVVVAGAQSVQVAKQITSTIPIVMASRRRRRRFGCEPGPSGRQCDRSLRLCARIDAEAD